MFAMNANCIIPPEDTDPKYLGIFTKNRSFYAGFFPLLTVIALQRLAAITVNLVDNLMLGSYSELALAGATLVNQLQFILQQAASGIGMGIVVLAAQYWGQRRTEPIRKIISVGVKAGLLIGALFLLLSLLMPAQILGLFTHDAAVIAEGTRYLKIICWTYLIFSLSNSLMYAMQGVETAMIGTVMSISTIFINLCLNYVLIYGHFGAPEMGIAGAAVATLISRTVELAIILFYILRIDRKLMMKVSDLIGFDGTYLRDFLKVSMPVVMSGFLWGIAQGAQTAVLGHIGAAVIAANSIATVFSQFFSVFGMACANTASIMTGKTIGEKNLHLVRSYSKTMQGIFVLMGLACGLLLFVFRDGIVGAYAISGGTQQLTKQFLVIISVTIVGSCYEYPVEAGIIAGGGTTYYTALVDNLFMWLFTIPSAVLSAYVFHFPPAVTYCFLKADQLLKCIPNAIVCNRYRWIRVLTR